MSTQTPRGRQPGTPSSADTDLESLRSQAGDIVLLGNTREIRKLADEGLLDRVLGKVTAWGRRSSVWPMFFGTACCFLEMAASATARYDIARFGSEVMRASPRQADLMIVAGTVTKKMVPVIVRLYHQMADPKWVMAMGACSISGGPFKEGYSVVSGIDEFIPVDIYIPGCPPKPEALLYGLMKLQEKIDHQPLSDFRWKVPSSKLYPIPVLGPDIVDVRQMDEIRRHLAELAHAPEAEAEAPAEEPRKRAERPGAVEAPTVAPGRMQVAGDGDTISALRGGFLTDERAAEGPLDLPADRLLDVARSLQAEHGWDYLSNLTSVDYPDRFEVVYHLFSSRRTGSPITMKVATRKDDPVVDSVVPVWRGANMQEREVYDMMGIRFAGHPNLKRVLLWEGFEGFPLRKDWREAYYEEPAKPFGSRWPAGNHIRAEERTPYGRNVAYPTDWDPAAWQPPSAAMPVVDAAEVKHGLVLTDNLTIRFGPQHPSTHGVFQMIVTLDGETIVRLEPVVGYLHRNHEKIGERNTYLQNIPYTDRLDYLSSMSSNLGYVLAVEKLLGVRVPERADYIRVLMAEFTRIANHFLAVGTYLNDLGASYTPALYGFEERELILDLFEATSGARMMCNYMRFGGVARDLPEDVVTRMHELAFERLPRSIAEVDRLVRENEILVARSKGVSVITAEHLLNSSVSGPMLRAAGVPYDIRKVEPYSVYDRFDFQIPTGTTGDLYDRFVVRLSEMYQSLSIIQQALRGIPGGEVLAGRKAWQVRVPKGESYARVEAPKGELGFFVVSDGSPNPYRYHVRAPSFINLTVLEDMCLGLKIADSVAVFGSVDINMGECDR